MSRRARPGDRGGSATPAADPGSDGAGAWTAGWTAAGLFATGGTSPPAVLAVSVSTTPDPVELDAWAPEADELDPSEALRGGAKATCGRADAAVIDASAAPRDGANDTFRRADTDERDAPETLRDGAKDAFGCADSDERNVSEDLRARGLSVGFVASRSSPCLPTGHVK